MSTSVNAATSNAKSSAKGPQVVLANGSTPQLSVMKKAAGVLGVKLPATKGESFMRELLGSLRLKITQLNADVPAAQQLVCEECGERSTEDTEYCPFCGDMGIAADDAEPQPVAASALSKLPEVSPRRDVEGGVANLEQQLSTAMARFIDLKKEVVDTTYEMGMICREIHELQLYKARGYTSFKQFAEANELPIARTTAYSLMRIVEQFSREEYNELGYKKLRTIGVLESGEREQAVAEAKDASSRELEQRVKSKRSSGAAAKESSSAEKRDKLKEPLPAKATEVTLLTKLDGKPRELKFKSAKTGLGLASAGKISQYDAHAYAEVELSPDVYLRIGLRVNGRDLVGLSADFCRVAEAK